MRCGSAPFLGLRGFVYVEAEIKLMSVMKVNWSNRRMVCMLNRLGRNRNRKSIFNQQKAKAASIVG